MPIKDLETIWSTNVPVAKRKFKDYSMDARIKMLIDLSFGK